MVLRDINILATAQGRKKLLRYAAIYFIVATASLAAGLQHFILTLPTAPSSQMQYTDGIVVMTGGQQRVDDGLALLADEKSGRMLITGVGKGVNRAVLVQELALNDQKVNALFCCVDLDYSARDTRENAIAAKQWATNSQMRSLRLVTASYHMPRALLVFAHEMPELDLYQWPVNPQDLKLENWWRDRSMLRLLAREYAKYLAETIRI